MKFLRIAMRARIFIAAGKIVPQEGGGSVSPSQSTWQGTNNLSLSTAQGDIT